MLRCVKPRDVVEMWRCIPDLTACRDVEMWWRCTRFRGDVEKWRCVDVEMS